MSKFTLFCLVNAESTGSAFSVKNISSSDTVDDLRKRIKEENSHNFHDVDAKDITLWHVSIPLTDDDSDDRYIMLDTLIDKKKLHPTTRLSKVFLGEPPEETIHIIVQRPSLYNLSPVQRPRSAGRPYNPYGSDPLL